MASSKENTKDITPDTPVEKLDLTTKQNKFVEYYCQGYTGVESAKLAGYDSDDYNTLHAIASENLRKPTIVAAIKDNRKDLRYRFQEEAGNAIRVILEIMNNSKVSGRTRLDAAKDLLDRAGYKPSDKIELSGVDGNPIEYETRQTKEIVNRARALLIDVVAEDVETKSIQPVRTVHNSHNCTTDIDDNISTSDN
jgi:phage terminase small subunit